MNGQGITRGRGGTLANALAGLQAELVVAAVDSDRLYPPRLSQELAEASGRELHLIKSPYGHDGFLIELDQVGPLIAKALSA
ncbi:hypothetical protein [Kribbella deserti]|uniref:Homoserine O-acetyltransferase n=1 Tax=Kribbella deserti TaxID=1926257 RepID=A0ABV6QPX8_9ACTN